MKKLRISYCICCVLILLTACSQPDDPYEVYENKKFEMAKTLLEPRVAEGNPKALTYLATIYLLEGECLLAEVLYLQAARKNYAAAQYQLGLLLKEGVVLEQNIEQAYGWLDLAAQQGHVKAREERLKIESEISDSQVLRAKSWAAEQLEG